MQPPASVDRLIVERVPFPFSDTDVNSAHQEEEERSAETDGHDGDHQRREEICRRSPDSRQHGPENSKVITLTTVATVTSAQRLLPVFYFYSKRLKIIY